MQSGFYPRDPVGKAFAGSIATHAAVLAVLVFSGFWNLNKNQFGSPNASTGSVGIDVVKTIPIPRNQGQVNPLANDTKSIVPQAPPPPVAKPQKEVKAEPDKAIPLPDKVEKPKKLPPAKPVESLFRPPDQYKENQVFAKIPQAVSTPMYGMQGAGGIDVDRNSVLGTRFGPYANLLRDRIAEHWNRSNLHSLPTQRCAISFVIARSGAVSNVQVSQPSGDYLLDTSAKRAVLDANPLPALPQQFDRNEVTVEIWFQLRQ